MANFESITNSTLKFRSKRTGEITARTISKVEIDLSLVSNLPTNTDMIKIDPEVQRAKDLGLVKE